VQEIGLAQLQQQQQQAAATCRTVAKVPHLNCNKLNNWILNQQQQQQ